MIALLLSNPLIVAIFGGVVAVIVAFFGGNVRGSRRERDKQAAERLKARKEADEIEDAIAGRSPEENRQRLRKWAK